MQETETLKTFILASGRGSNAQKILEYASTDLNSQQKRKLQVCAVISDNPKAKVLDIAREFNIPFFVISDDKEGNTFFERMNSYGEKLLFETQKIEEELELKVDYILCAGFMKILSKKFLEYFQSEDHKIYKVVNIHPSLLPSFPGKNGYGDAFHYGVKVAGVTTHFVDEKIDNGPILYQESFKRLDSDDLESFTSRGLSVEYELYKKTIQVLQNNNFKVEKFKDRFFVKVVEPKHES